LRDVRAELVSPPTGSARASHSLPPAARRAANAVGPPVSHSQGLTAVVGASSMSAAASYSPKTPGMSAVRNLPNDRNVHLERRFQFALYRLLATCHAARRTSTTRGSSGLPPSGLTPNNGSSSRLRSGLDVGGCALALCLRPRPSRWPWPPRHQLPPVRRAPAGSRGRQFIDTDFNGSLIVSASLDGAACAGSPIPVRALR
jgi:hypothetical protein